MFSRSHIDPRSFPCARFRSVALVQSMFLDMESLSTKQRSINSIVRYILAAHNYKIDKIIIGDKPYSDELVPYLGLAYSQVEHSDDTPTTEVIKVHFDSQSSVGNAFRESWKLFPEGYLFINSCYLEKPNNDVLLLESMERTIEFISVFCIDLWETNISSHFTIMSLGSMAKYVVSRTSHRLKCRDIPHKSLHAVQPVAYYRYMGMRNKVGIHP